MFRAIPYTSLWFGTILWTVLGGGLLWAAGWWLYEDYLFAYDSKPVTGIVERVYITTSHGRHGSTTTYHIAYHYQVDSTTIGARTSVARDTYGALTPGKRIPVLYLPAQIGNSRIDLPAEQSTVRWTTWGLSLAALAVAIIGAFILRHYVRQNNLYRFLLDRGVQCQGIVDAVPYTLVGKAQTPRYYLTFTFHDSSGRTLMGQTGYLKIGYEGQWSAGKAVQVYFDPANPERFTVDIKRAPLDS